MIIGQFPFYTVALKLCFLGGRGSTVHFRIGIVCRQAKTSWRSVLFAF